jgi:glycosyltransferase involved in cell wall biosynthesis
LISGRDIIVLSNVDWDLLWQANQELASRLARAGNRVLYVENLGVRSPRVGDARRVLSRLRGWSHSLAAGSVREVAPAVHVCSPLVLPPFGSPPRRALNRLAFLRSIRRAASRLGMRDPVLWTYLPTDASLDLLDLLRSLRSVVVYMCVADFEELTPHRDRLREAERALLGSSDLVLARGPSLAARCARWSDRVHEFELGVSLEAFPMPAGDGSPRRDEARASLPSTPLANLPRPVVGYVGALHRHLDLRLAVAMAAARPHWSWVYVGPAQVPVRELASRPNVRLVGHVPHGGLAGYIESFDVGIVPYRLEAVTNTVFPAKLLEYLAMGKPVVSTPLPEVRRFDGERQMLTEAPPQPVAFLTAIEEALARDTEDLRAARRRAVAPLDWGAQLERISGLIESSAPPG